jgi:hypothetical protein|tara:strand:+ start:351 stop:518 length:168 start_codon:yes stop_codon:yes gene_type:complete
VTHQVSSLGGYPGSEGEENKVLAAFANAGLPLGQNRLIHDFSRFHMLLGGNSYEH